MPDTPAQKISPEHLFPILLSADAAWWMGTAIHLARQLPKEVLRRLAARDLAEDGILGPEEEESLDQLFLLWDEKTSIILKQLDELAAAGGLLEPEPEAVQA